MNWSDLNSLVADYIGRDDMTTNIEHFIRMAQRKIERGGHNYKCMETRATGTLSTSNNYISIPSSFKEVKAFFVVNSNGDYQPLTKVNISELTGGADNDLPSEFATDHAQSKFIFDTTPDSAYTYVLYYWAYLPELSTSNTTNWWTDNAWELLLYGALIEAQPYMVNDTRIATWAALYDAGISDLKKTEIDEEGSGHRHGRPSMIVI